jgi:hypothetical protein
MTNEQSRPADQGPEAQWLSDTDLELVCGGKNARGGGGSRGASNDRIPFGNPVWGPGGLGTPYYSPFWGARN